MARGQNMHTKCTRGCEEVRGQNMHTKCTRGCEEVAGEDVAQELDEHSTVLVIIEIELSKQTEEIGQPWYCRSENKRAGDAMIRTR